MKLSMNSLSVQDKEQFGYPQNKDWQYDLIHKCWQMRVEFKNPDKTKKKNYWACRIDGCPRKRVDDNRVYVITKC